MIKNIELRAADNIRILSASMVEKAKSGHPGGAMGGADFINILYSEFLNYDPSDMNWAYRDRFFLDPGHMSPMLYSVLALSGYYTMDDLREFRQWGSVTPGHPEVDFKRGVENTSGPLGQGHTMAVGAAIAERFLVARFGEWMAHKTYTFISDGGIQEEISQGAGRIAGHLGLNNLIMFYDSNDIQLSTTVDDVTSEDTAKKYIAWGWNVSIIDGNNASEIREALKLANSSLDKPTLIIGKTIMGKGCLQESGENFEGKTATHGQPISAAGASFKATIENLGGNPENPFQVFPEVEELYLNRKGELLKFAAEKKKIEKEWTAENKELAVKLERFLSGEVPDFDFSKIEQNPNSATRGASATVLSAFANEIENMLVSSADLSNSDKTDGFLKNTTSLNKNDFSGAFLQAGVCELTMASIMNGVALHGGLIPVCGTFFVFSDYMKPATRLSALMELPVIYIWTHDAFRVGEDGPTHQPIEQEAQIRLMEKLQNHSGRNSMLVLRPADVVETTVAWKMALENKKTPTALILSRQNIKNLPVENPYINALKAAKGAYVVVDCVGTPDIVLLASGSEVSTLIESTDKLKEDFKVRVVSVPSEGLFRSQELEYQQSVLPAGIPRFGLTAGLSVNLEGLVGENGKVWGLNHFGYSAPATVLDDKFGFTPEHISKEIINYMKLNS
ncbi:MULTISPECIES: transketolase family protein [Flavobacteriaceae]|uniref:transketolase n=2 Tax=Flavobacteriaceae TaxID=49546 RepID=A0A4Y8AUJ3_9FLAO|nr:MULTISPECIES: transketolase [Flavobacteriaceae]TEW75564.1 transketolase [Gramella jeungdoensis]GGK46203.1 transketolase [Lutibacter litoralis]